jgi:hypothetical protein
MLVFPSGSSKNRSRKFFVNLGVTRYRFLSLPISPDVMSPAVAQQRPAKLAESFL